LSLSPSCRQSAKSFKTKKKRVNHEWRRSDYRRSRSPGSIS
jgi:hypothetical protein